MDFLLVAFGLFLTLDTLGLDVTKIWAQALSLGRPGGPGKQFCESSCSSGGSRHFRFLILVSWTSTGQVFRAVPNRGTPYHLSRPAEEEGVDHYQPRPESQGLGVSR